MCLSLLFQHISREHFTKNATNITTSIPDTVYSLISNENIIAKMKRINTLNSLFFLNIFVLVIVLIVK